MPGDSFCDLKQDESFCNKCKKFYPLRHFYSNKGRLNGKSSYCRNCDNASCKDWEKRNREYVNRKKREYRAEIKAMIEEGKRREGKG